MLNNIFYSSSAQKILYFLLAHPEERFYDREISRLAKVSRASANYSLRTLTGANIAKREKRGRMYFYYVTLDDPIIRQLKITQNIISLRPLVEKLKELSLKIALYGSSAQGTNHANSDIDLFVLSREIKRAKELILKSSLKEKIKYVVNSPQDFIIFKKENPVFYRQILSGKILYEAKE
ncbi:MAG: nucleotidyltransferase domain-containing protein [Candidatus Omnitrophica bacterium]|nr:nucleotidyltransferase domain-containing protein [Candidatus Omnitrophota bacterium]